MVAYFGLLIKMQFRDVLSKLSYKDFSFNPNNQSCRAIKHGTEFYADHVKLVFGFHNKNINSLIEAQKEFFAITDKEYKTRLSEYVRFYEIECVSNIITEKNTSDIFRKISNDFSMKNNVETILGKHMRLNTLEFSSHESFDTDQWDQIEVSPKIESNGKMYFCRLLSRNTTQDSVYKMLRRSSEMFEQVIQKLEQS